MYKISVEKLFSAAHALRGYKGKCEGLHGHNWKVQVVISGKKLNKIGLLEDFREVKKNLNKVLEKLDHKNLKNIPPFNRINPTAENIACYIYDKMKKSLKSKNCKISEVKVWESDTSSASFSK
ncbi:MAG: 6-carboxytetrahydropterin synthase QueD [Endomicrobiales bacterium]|nr:6-carboxytetrahydropterin synthase QueD [Endomicrobiales bacterium]